MENRTYYNEILTEHNLHPYHKHKLEMQIWCWRALIPAVVMTFFWS